MVSKIFALSLLAAVASNVNAYYWHAETVFQHLSQDILQHVIHPVDIQVPGNDEALAAVGGIVLNEDTEGMTIPFKKHGYEDINLALDRANDELISLRAMDINFKEKAVFPCVKMDEIEEVGFYNHMVTRKVYSCGNPAYYGRKGIPVPTTTTRAVPTTTTTVAVATTTPPPAIVTTTTTNVVTTTTVPTTTTTTTTTATTIVTSVATEPITTTTLAPKPTPACLAGYRGKRNGKGPNGACCSHSDDCKDTCVKGVCGVSL